MEREAQILLKEELEEVNLRAESREPKAYPRQKSVVNTKKRATRGTIEEI